RRAAAAAPGPAHATRRAFEPGEPGRYFAGRVRPAVMRGGHLDVLDIAPAITVRPIAIPFLQKPLILALQFVVEHHALDARALLVKTLCRSQIRTMELRVVRQLTRLYVAGIEGLSGLTIASPMRLQQVSPAFGQSHHGRALSTVKGRHRANQSRRSQAVQVAMA